jgi:Ion channel
LQQGPNLSAKSGVDHANFRRSTCERCSFHLLGARLFHVNTNLHNVPDRFDFIYYSFCTMTSLGAAGITAVSSQARSFSILEAILGVLYLAVLITGLIGAYRPKSGA